MLTVCGLAVADFLREGRVSRELLGALIVLSLTFAGAGADRIFKRWLP